MYTVLIQSKQTMDSLQQFYPIFSEAVEAGRMDTCQWIESGVTVNTAVPELYDLVSRKRNWRAIIVSAELEDADCKFPADRKNPFDFLENAEGAPLAMEDGKLIDSDIPLIRLTHLLGGVPTPEPEFQAVTVDDGERVPHTEYRLVENDETEQRRCAYAQWREAHRFHGAPPTEIILVKMRQPADEQETLSCVRSTWQIHNEMESSQFCKRNFYPSNCRFLCYEMDQRGVMQRQQDLFKLWLSIRLLGENVIDPNVLQAGRLYSLNIFLDEAAMTNSFQNMINSLNMAKFEIQKSIQKDELLNAGIEKEIPDYAVGVPIAFQKPKVSQMQFKQSQFGLTGGPHSDDLNNWEQYRFRAQTELKELIVNTERTLDHAASQLHDRNSYADAEVTELTPYQEEDMQSSLDSVYQEILADQEALPESICTVQEEAAELHKVVKRKILQRMDRRQAVTGVLIACGSALATLLPGCFLGGGSCWPAVAAAASAAILSGTAFLVLRSQRKDLIEAGKRFQLCLMKVISELSHHATLFSDFFTDVASYSHGKSYLEIMKRKRIKRDSSYYFKQKHLKSIEILLSKLSLWSSALHIEVDMNSVDAIDLMEDENERIDYDTLYAMESRERKIPLNDIGIYIRSPFAFVKKLSIEREEVYDDV